MAITNPKDWRDMYLAATGHPPYCNQTGPQDERGLILICCRYENHRGMHMHDRGGLSGRMETRWV